MITGATRLVGLIGWPVAHSRSPRMHNAAFAAAGLNWVYLPLPVPPERIGDAVRGLPALGFAGANVTVPHKQAVIPFLDELSPTSAAIGSVNTIVVRDDGSLLGDSTDGDGFLADIAQALDRPHPDGTLRPLKWRGDDEIVRALVLGAGGAARAVCHALLSRGATVEVANRNWERARELCQDMERALPNLQEDSIGALNWQELPRVARWADLIVNCTSLGLREPDPMPWDPAVPFLPGQVVYDTVYNHPTPFLAFARACGATAMDGLGMLVHQGALSFQLWTGIAPPLEVMQAAVTGARTG